MPKLKLGAIADDRPVKLTVELPANVIAISPFTPSARPRNRTINLDPAKLIAPMLARFMATDRAFAKARRKMEPAQGNG